MLSTTKFLDNFQKIIFPQEVLKIHMEVNLKMAMICFENFTDWI